MGLSKQSLRDFIVACIMIVCLLTYMPNNHDNQVLTKSGFAHYPRPYSVRTRAFHGLPEPCAKQEPTQKLYQQQIKAVCQARKEQEKLVQNLPHSRAILVDDKRRLIACTGIEAGMPLWTNLILHTSEDFINTTGDTVGAPFSSLTRAGELAKVGIKFLEDYSPEERNYRLRHYFKVMFVRNPMHKLVSAFQDRHLSDQSSTTQMRDTRNIYQGLNVTKDPSNGPKWQQYVQSIIDMYREEKEMHPQSDAYSHLCHPCIIKYDYISKLEDQSEAGDCPYSYLTGGRRSELPTLYLNQTLPQHTTTSIRSHYHLLSKTQFNTLLSIYNMDCEMFHYNCDSYHQL